MEYTPINTKQEGDCGYICMYGDKKVALYAKDMWAAKVAAIAHFKVKKSKEYLVSAYLCEKSDGSQYVQSTSF